VIRRLVVVLALLLTCALTAPGIASARPSGGSDVDPFNGYRLKTFCHFGNCARGEVRVEVWGDIDLPDPGLIATRTRGYGKVTNRTALRVRIDKVNLGSKFGVERTVSAGASTTHVARRATPWDSLTIGGVPDSTAPCQYRVRVYFSIRWRDGKLGKATLLSDLYTNPNSPACHA
jgi:hypothetical protein